MTLPITSDFIFEVPSVSQPYLSGDGSTLAFVKTTIDRASMERKSRIFVSRRPFDRLSALTGGPSDSAPVVVNGSLFFLRPDEQDKKQVWTIPLDGGEPRRITGLDGGVQEFVLSPSGDTIAAVSTVDPDASARQESGMPRVRIVRRIRYRSDERGFLGDAFRQIFTMDAGSGTARQITHGEGDNWSPKWSPDGTSLAFVSDDVEDRDFTAGSQAKVVNLPDGQPVSWSASLPYVWAVAWSPDGQSLAAVGSHDPELWDPRSAWLYVLDAGGSVRRITDGLYTPVSECGLSWTAERGIAFVAAHHGEYFVCSVRADGSGFKTITSGGVNVEDASFDGSASRAVILAQSPKSLGELADVDLNSGAAQAVTAYSKPYLDLHTPARMEKFTIQRAGFKIESRVLLPPGFDETKRYPMVVDIHGGPNGRFSDNFDPIHQILATNGYVVLTVNPRGSSTYSPEFTKAVLNDWGGEDYLDILASVEELAARPYVDSDRMALHGYSYGGFMSAWIVGHDHRFKAAAVAAMCANLHSMYGTSDIGPTLGEIYWGGVYSEARDKFLFHSPHHIRTQCPDSRALVARRERRAMQYRAKRAVLRGAQAPRQGGRVRQIPGHQPRIQEERPPGVARRILPARPGLAGTSRRRRPKPAGRRPLGRRLRHCYENRSPCKREPVGASPGRNRRGRPPAGIVGAIPCGRLAGNGGGNRRSPTRATPRTARLAPVPLDSHGNGNDGVAGKIARPLTSRAPRPVPRQAPTRDAPTIPAGGRPYDSCRGTPLRIPVFT